MGDIDGSQYYVVQIARYDAMEAEIERLRAREQDLRKHAEQDACEIEWLRIALALAVGEMSTSGEYSYLSPKVLMNKFLEEARRDHTTDGLVGRPTPEASREQ